MALPSQFLPSLSRPISQTSQTPTLLSSTLERLSDLLFPSVEGALARTGEAGRSSGIKRRPLLDLEDGDGVIDSGYSSEIEPPTQSQRTGGKNVPSSAGLVEHPEVVIDEFERSHARSWLLRLMGRAEEWACEPDAVDEEDEYTPAGEERAAVASRAAELLSKLSEVTESGAIVREQAFQRPPLPDGSPRAPIAIKLHDAAVSSHTSVGLQSWGSSLLLARHIALNPSSFGLCHDNARVLELGAGTGLLSMLVGKLGIQAVATDYHEEVLSNLKTNVGLNFPDDSRGGDAGVLPDVQKLDWADVHAATQPGTAGAPLPPAMGRFPTILAADCIYAPEHALWLRSCVLHYLSRTPEATFHLFFPLRIGDKHQTSVAAVANVFGGKDGDVREGLQVRSARRLEKEKGTGREDESGYQYLVIGWAA